MFADFVPQSMTSYSDGEVMVCFTITSNKHYGFLKNLLETFMIR